MNQPTAGISKRDACRFPFQAPSHRMQMNLLLGFGTVIVCVVVQCAFVGLLLRLLIMLDFRRLIRPSFSGSTVLLGMVMLLMLAGNLIQVAVWAAIFVWLGEFQDFTTAFYHSVVNFSTLGSGDILMSEEHRLLGALEAANGVIMFGLSTSAMFMVLSSLMQKAWQSQEEESGKSLSDN